MKSKLCWATFIPVTLIAIILKALESFSVIPSLPGKMLSYTALGLILLTFIINIIFVASDKETSPAYLLSRNVPAAVFLLISAAMITSKSALTIILALQNNKFDFLILAMTLLGIVTAVCLVVISLAHIQGRNFLPRMGAFLLVMPVWAGLVLVYEFLENRKVSVADVDEFKLFALAFMMIFLFKLSMIISTVDGRNPVKAMFLYGLPMASLCLSIGAVNVFDIIKNGIDYSENVFGFALCALGIYAVLFIREITSLMRTKSEQVIKFDLDDFDEQQRVYGAYQDNYVATPDEQTGDYDYDYTSASEESEVYVTEKDKHYTSDYDYDYSYGGYGGNSDQDDLVAPPEAPTEDDDVIYVDSDVVDDFEEKVLHSSVRDVESPVNDKETEYDDEQMAKIDKLIEDINS
ncbi:MAG: hypothetical protein IJ932_00420 [Ruminococcus sp.]|nr:hypothetical protein [Ruminococcus sp.]